MPTPSWRLQRLTASELPALLNLAALDPHTWKEEAWRSSLQQDEVWGLCSAHQEVAGVVVLGQGYLETEILYLLVSPLQRRQGLATTLLDWAASRAVELGSERLLLELRSSNKAALALYQQQGFKIDGQRKNYYPCQASATGREDALLMSLGL